MYSKFTDIRLFCKPFVRKRKKDNYFPPAVKKNNYLSYRLTLLTINEYTSVKLFIFSSSLIISRIYSEDIYVKNPKEEISVTQHKTK